MKTVYPDDKKDKQECWKLFEKLCAKIKPTEEHRKIVSLLGQRKFKYVTMKNLDHPN